MLAITPLKSGGISRRGGNDVRISKWFAGILLGAVLAAGALAPATSEAASLAINNVTVVSTQPGSVQTWCISGCVDPGAGPIWAAGAGTVVNSPNTAGNKQLILTQTSGFNFDISENGVGGTPCGATPCTITLNVNGVNIPLALNNALNNFNGDPGGASHNEAQNWTTVFNGGPGGLLVDIGYADNAHTDACTDTNGADPTDCLPIRSQRKQAVSFLSAPLITSVRPVVALVLA